MSREHHTGRLRCSRTDAYRMRTQLMHGAGDRKRWEVVAFLDRTLQRGLREVPIGASAVLILRACLSGGQST